MARGGGKRPVWKGEIAFGLVNIPITLYPGSSASELDFDLIDKRDMAPVGYRRINKRTGKEITEDNIVKGYRYEDDQYVIMVEDMTEEWDPRQYHDTYREDLLARVEAKAKAGKSAIVTQPEEGKEPRRSAEIIDLMSLLKSSLKGKEEGDKAGKKKTTARSESSPRRNRREDAGSPRRRKRA